MRQISLANLFYAFMAIALLTGCAETQQARSVGSQKTTGFLGDYSSLSKGSDDQALLRYVKPGVDFSQYQQAMIAPVTIWTAPGSNLGKLSDEEQKNLANRFYAHLKTKVSEVMPITQTVQPRVLKIEVALTDAEKSRAVLDTISTVMPIGLAASTVKQGFTGKASFTGETGMEIKISDAYTGEVLAAAVDKRVGTKRVRGVTNRWADADGAMKYWSELLAYRICEYRGRQNCRAPEA